MFEHINNVFKKIFNNEETIIFSLIIVLSLVVLNFFAAVLTPFIISIVVAYLLVGLQKKIETYNISESIALMLSFKLRLIKYLFFFKQYHQNFLPSPKIL